MTLHVTLLLSVLALYGLLAYSTHKVSDDIRCFGTLLIFVPILTLSGLYTLYSGASTNYSSLWQSIVKFWWVFLLYAPLVWLSNWFRAHGVFKNNFTSSAVLINFAVVFSLAIEVIFFSHTLSATLIIGTILLISAAALSHGRSIPITVYAWFILAHCLLSAINRNVDYFLIANGTHIVTILFLQNIIITPILIFIRRKKLKGKIRALLTDKAAVSAMLTAMLAVPLSFLSVSMYGPSETMIAVTAGWLIFGLADNYRTLNISMQKAAFSAAMAFAAVVLITSGQ